MNTITPTPRKMLIRIIAVFLPIIILCALGINITAHKRIPSYTSNEQYAEQIDLQSMYDVKCNIVMLGNSFIYKVHWNELLNRSDVINRGIGSDITSGYLNRLENVFKARPKICFVEGGINDLCKDVPIDTIVHNMKLLVDTLQRKKIKVVLTSIIHVGEAYPESSRVNQKIDLLNGVIKKEFARNIPIIDLNPILSPGGVLLDRYAQRDAIHLTSKAYIIWKDVIEKTLKQESI
ncbi:Lysophospholipase L1 [Chitinophaga sp. CF118]|uniref:GDSL-type esterase/lipase family protein n=1 Tax=Chitinophaga sp. CF118 TaxID=1884367 RepID=UPI0008EB4FCA|nr:GDSL-type esterase/lipase family protein [Chitinophaga sp. CF118]SFD65535.1 Lysophospholipase L1 [Chitinophaga sp. CF118]